MKRLNLYIHIYIYLLYIHIYLYIYIYIIYIYVYVCIVACKQINGKNARSHIAKEHCESFIRNKNTKSVKKIRNNYLSTKNFEIPNTFDIKSVIKEHLKTSDKFFLYSDTKKSKKFLNEKLK